jgi:hypothetical protein
MIKAIDTSAEREAAETRERDLVANRALEPVLPGQWG